MGFLWTAVQVGGIDESVRGSRRNILPTSALQFKVSDQLLQHFCQFSELSAIIFNSKFLLERRVVASATSLISSAI